MAEDHADNDGEFLGYLERLVGKCKPLTEVIDQRIREILKSSPPATSGPDNPDQSGNYLERQNARLLDLLVKEKGLSTQDEPGPTSDVLPPPQSKGKLGPPAKPPVPPPTDPTRPKPFWR